MNAIGTMAAAAEEKNHHQHPLMYLHANEGAAANNINRPHVKREMEPTPDAQNDDKKVEPMKSPIQIHSRVKSAIIAIILLFVVMWIHATLQEYEIIDNKIATSAIILHHCHSFMVICATVAYKLLYVIKNIIIFLIAESSSSSGEKVTLEQFHSRLQKGQQLLAQYNDIAGSEMVCKSVANSIVIAADERKQNNKMQIGDESRDSTNGDTESTFPLSYSSIISMLLTQEESELLSKSLSCVAEANLNLFYQHKDQHQLEYLSIAKSYLDNALLIEPTDPLIRANVGLTYLLLGTLSSSDDDAIQHLLQSIQHLNVAIGILQSSNMDANEESGEVLYMAALHNLGLANLALGGFDDNNDHFLDWINSLQSLEEESSILEMSGLYTGNRGVSLLQNDKIDEAIVGLTSLVNEFCDVDRIDDGKTARRKHPLRSREICSIARYNLATTGEGIDFDERNKIHVNTLIENTAQSHGQNITIEKVTNEEMPSSKALIEESNNTEDNISDVIDTSSELRQPNEDNEESQDDLNRTQEVDIQQQVEIASDTSNGVVDVETPAPQEKTEMQNALVALERAAESSQQSRLLLILGKALVSSGDFSGAVDASLKAINAAKTQEETDISTSYLEDLMDRIADEEGYMVRALPADDSSNQQDLQKEISPAQDQLTQMRNSLIGEHELSTTELQLKLELEKLKYKVLEQELRFSQQQVWNHPRNEFNTENVKAIDYRESVNSDDNEDIRASIFPQGEVEVDTRNDAHESETIQKERNYEVPMQNNTVLEEEEIIEPLIESEETSETNTLDFNDIAEESDIESNSQEQLQPEVEVEVVKTYGDDPDVIDFDEETIVVKGEKKDVDEEDDGAPEVEEKILVVDELVEEENEELFELPSLFSPVHGTPSELTAHAKSYMKMADAYLDKGQYHLASKQFLKVIKKVPDHLPAHLGYATALERDGKSKQISAAALAYGNATRVAIIQSEPIDPLVKSGGGGIAESILRRAVKIAKTAPSERLETLRILSTYAHTAALASEIYYEIGAEISTSDVLGSKEAFLVANGFITMRNDNESPFHIGSIIELGKLALDSDKDANKAIEYFNKVKDVDMVYTEQVKLLLLIGRAHMKIGEIEVAITELTRALSLPESPVSQEAHHELAIVLSKNNADKHEIDFHFKKALDLGMDPTVEAIEALGERNMSVMRALNRQYYKQFNNQADDGRSEGGILSGAGVGSQASSIFSQQASQDDSSASDPLSLLEQGASSYDANNVMGGAVEAESNLSNLSNRR